MCVCVVWCAVCRVSPGRVNLLRTWYAVRCTQCTRIPCIVRLRRTKRKQDSFSFSPSATYNESRKDVHMFETYAKIICDFSWKQLGEARESTCRCTNWNAQTAYSRDQSNIEENLKMKRTSARALHVCVCVYVRRICRYQWRGNKCVIKSSTLSILKRESPIWLLCTWRHALMTVWHVCDVLHRSFKSDSRRILPYIVQVRFKWLVIICVANFYF